MHRSQGLERIPRKSSVENEVSVAPDIMENILRFLRPVWTRTLVSSAQLGCAQALLAQIGQRPKGHVHDYDGKKLPLLVSYDTHPNLRHGT